MDSIGLTISHKGETARPTLPPRGARPDPVAIEPPRAKRLDYLDGWRGLSLICVLIGHFARLAGMRFGPLGVELFFVLSGRLMAEILFVEQFPLKAFYIRRFSRIFPALALFAVATFFLFLATPLRFKPEFVATDLTFTYNYFAVAGHRTEPLDHIWSLCIEEHAYLLLGLLALLSRVRRIPALPLIAALTLLSMLDGVVSTLVFHQNWFDAYWRSDTHVASVLVSAGVYLAARRRALPAWLTPVCAALGVALFADPAPWAGAYTAGTLLLALAVAGLDSAPAWLRKILSLRVLTWAGVLSYSIYLWQQPFYTILLHGPATPTRTLMLLAGGILAGVASFHLLEQPARQFLNRTLTGAKSRRAAAAATAAE